MIPNPDALTAADEAIRELAGHVRALRRCGQRLNRTLGAILCVSVAASMADLGRRVYIGPAYGAALLFVPFLPALVQGFAAHLRAGRADRKLRAIFQPNDSDARKQFSSAAIGPLLDILASTIHDLFLSDLMNLLDELLKALTPRDGVHLSKDQRDVLHALLLPGSLDQTRVCSATTLREPERHKVRPTVVRALGLLGNDVSIRLLEQFAGQTKSPALRQAALYSVGQISERHRYGSEQLLRAGQAADRPETLLRTVPTAKPREYDSQQLLRAAHKDSI